MGARIDSKSDVCVRYGAGMISEQSTSQQNRSRPGRDSGGIGTSGSGTVTVGIDIGTTSVKVLAADEAGSTVAGTRVPYPIDTAVPGALQHNAAHAWRDCVRAALLEISELATGDGYRIASVSVAAMVPSLCAVDADGVPISAGIMYGDPRIGAPPQRGLPPSSDGEFLRMLTWMAQQYPQAAGYWPAQAVANAALTGEGVMDTVTAMTCVPVFDYTEWDPGVVAEINVDPRQLPRLVSGSEPAGTISGLGADLEGIPVTGGSIDAFCEQLVAGCNNEGDVLVVIGATLIVWGVLDEWREVPGLWTVPHTAEGKTLIGGPSNAGGIAMDFAGRVLAGRVTADRGEHLGDPGEVPVFLPYLRGERVPLHDPGRRAEFHGLTSATTPAAMWRSVQESSGFVIRRILTLADMLGPDASTRAKRLVVTGGGAMDPGWLQAIADTTGVEVHPVAEPKGAALGGALLARQMVSTEEVDISGGVWEAMGTPIEPQAEYSEAAQGRYETFISLSGEPFTEPLDTP